MEAVSIGSNTTVIMNIGTIIGVILYAMQESAKRATMKSRVAQLEKEVTDNKKYLGNMRDMQSSMLVNNAKFYAKIDQVLLDIGEIKDELKSRK